MNIWRIAQKEIKQSFRDVRTLVLMLAFPIVLMLILGSALTNAFNSDFSLGKVEVLYQNKASGQLSQSFQGLIESTDKSGIHFIKESNSSKAKKAIENGKYAGYAEVSDKGITYFGNERQQLESGVVQGVLNSFLTKYKAAAELAKKDPKLIHSVLMSSPHNFIEEKALNASRQPGSMDYYAIAMTTMIALYGSISASFLIRSERTRNTSIRLAAAPVSKIEIFIGKVIGSLLTNGLAVLLVVLFSKYVFGVDWGSHFGLVMMVILAEVLFAVSFGLGLSYITKTPGGQRAISMIMVQVASFFGGAYFPVGNEKGFSKIVTDLSPLHWSNTAIMKLIYNNDTAAALPVISLFIGLAALFLAISAGAMSKREGI